MSKEKDHVKQIEIETHIRKAINKFKRKQISQYTQQHQLSDVPTKICLKKYIYKHKFEEKSKMIEKETRFLGN